MSLQLCPTLCDPMEIACQAPLSMGFSRQEYWGRLPFPPPGNLPDPGIKPAPLKSPAFAGQLLTTSTNWEAHLAHTRLKNSKCLQGLIPLEALRKNQFLDFSISSFQKPHPFLDLWPCTLSSMPTTVVWDFLECHLSSWPRPGFCCCCSVTKSFPTLSDLMDCSTPGFPVLHYLLEFAQTHVHWVDDAV